MKIIGSIHYGIFEKNWEKITSDTISGVLIRVIAAGLLLILGIIAVPKFVALPEDSPIIKIIVGILPFTIGALLAYLPSFMVLLRNWSSEARSDRIRELELRNENLKLELELQRQKQQSLPDDEE